MPIAEKGPVIPVRLARPLPIAGIGIRRIFRAIDVLEEIIKVANEAVRLAPSAIRAADEDNEVLGFELVIDGDDDIPRLDFGNVKNPLAPGPTGSRSALLIDASLYHDSSPFAPMGRGLMTP
jgi:hypothetical protein